MGLLDWIAESAKAQYAKGEPYRQAIGGLLQGDATKLGLLAQDFNRRAQTPEGALDVALNFAPMGILSVKPLGMGTLPILETLNPTGVGSRSGLHADYTPEIRATQPLGANLVSIDKTMGGNPDDLITIYRGAPKNQKKIVPGDFITDMKELAQSYTGDGNVLSMQVRRGDVLDDITEPLGNEYIYRPNADKYKATSKKK